MTVRITPSLRRWVIGPVVLLLGGGRPAPPAREGLGAGNTRVVPLPPLEAS